MDDIGRDYFKNEEISIEFVENLKVPGLEKIIKYGWHIGVPVEDDQFHKPEGSGILIYINDDNKEIISYLDCSMGRPIPLAAELGEDGKYKLTKFKG